MTLDHLHQRRRLKFVATINDNTLTEETDPDYEIQYIDIGNVDSNGKVGEVASYKFQAAPSRARRIVHDGDVIISTVRTYLQAIAHIENPSEDLIVSTGFAVIRPKRGVLDARFAKFALREQNFLNEVMMRSTGVSYPAITASEVADISISLPPLPTQRRIAEFLDRETVQIDALIEAKEQMLALLQEKRAAQINRMVTKGLDPSAEMKDSGLKWLEEIPKHWGVRRGKVLFEEIDSRSETGEETLLSLRMGIGLVPHNDVSEKPIIDSEIVGYKLTLPGEIVINRMRASIGLIAETRQIGLVSPDYAVYRSKIDLKPQYYVELFKTGLLGALFRSESKGLGTGSSGFLRLYSDNFLNLMFPYPPAKEQQGITAAVASQDKQDKQFTGALNASLTLLRERRSALITAAVTGQLAEVL